MNSYEIWFDLAPGTDEPSFSGALQAFLAHLEQSGVVAAHRVRRRKFGFGPDGLGEFCVTLDVTGLAQLDEAFGLVGQRDGHTEVLHAAVFRHVRNFRSGLYRDWPDAIDVRMRRGGGAT